MLIKSVWMILFGVLNNNLKAMDTGVLWKNCDFESCLQIHNMLSYCKHKAGESSVN